MPHIYYRSLAILHDETERYLLSKAMLDKQKCWENLTALIEAHELKLIIYDMIEETNIPKLLKSLGKDLTEIEFELQRLWKFKKDINYHRFWEYPKCACPELDNIDAYPFRRFINLTCPLHGE